MDTSSVTAFLETYRVPYEGLEIDMSFASHALPEGLALLMAQWIRDWDPRVLRRTVVRPCVLPLLMSLEVFACERDWQRQIKLREEQDRLARLPKWEVIPTYRFLPLE